VRRKEKHPRQPSGFLAAHPFRPALTRRLC